MTTTVLVVEDGSFAYTGGHVVPGANTYIDVPYLLQFAEDRGITLVNDPTILILTAMDYIETTLFVGEKWTRDQVLQWPRINVFIDGWYQNLATIPFHLLKGQAMVCLAIDEGNGPLIDIPRETESEEIGPVKIRYRAGSAPLPIVRTINRWMYKIMQGGNGTNFKIKKA